jgi:predicted nucleotidyltransferase
MRVTRETLIRLAKENAKTRAFDNKDIVAAYLFGSLLNEDSFIGGVTDIDMVFVTANKPPRTREIVKLTGDFHLDITYHARAEYTPARELRVNPWLGPEIYNPLLLYEREKFFDFVQAAVRAGFEFHSPALTLQRCRALLSHGRGVWTDLLEVGATVSPKNVAHYLKAVYHAACAVAELNGNPLAERRLLLDFPALAEKADRPQMAAALPGLLGGARLEGGIPADWLPAWQTAFLAAAGTVKADARIHAARLGYYHKAFEAMSGLTALWPLIHTWTLSALVLPAGQNKEWQAAVSQLGLSSAEFGEKVEGLDQFLDEVEILLDEIASANGLETSTSI